MMDFYVHFLNANSKGRCLEATNYSEHQTPSGCRRCSQSPAKERQQATNRYIANALVQFAGKVALDVSDGVCFYLPLKSIIWLTPYCAAQPQSH